jgi:hypothetical protein
MDGDLSTPETTENTNTNTTRESEDHEVQETSSYLYDAAVHGVDIDNDTLILLGAMSHHALSLSEEPREPTEEDLLPASSAAAASGTQTHGNTREPPRARIEQLADETSEESTQPKYGLYKAEENFYRDLSKLTEEQWERLRTALCVESSLDFPISLQVSALVCRYKERRNPEAWFEGLIDDIDSLAAFAKEGSQPVANFPPIRTIGMVPSSAEVCEQRSKECTINLTI